MGLGLRISCRHLESGFLLRDLIQVTITKETIIYTIDPYYGNVGSCCVLIRVLSMDPSIFGDKGPGFVNNIFGDKGPRFVNQVPTLTLYLNPLTRTQDPQTPICHN